MCILTSFRNNHLSINRREEKEKREERSEEGEREERKGNKINVVPKGTTEHDRFTKIPKI